MNKKTTIIALLGLVISIEASAQVETSKQNLPTTTNENLPVHLDQQPMIDSLNFRQNAYQHEKDMANYRTMCLMPSAAAFPGVAEGFKGNLM